MLLLVRHCNINSGLHITFYV